MKKDVHRNPLSHTFLQLPPKRVQRFDHVEHEKLAILHDHVDDQ